MDDQHREIERSLNEAVEKGWMEAQIGEDGEVSYRVTLEGEKHVQDLISQPGEMADLWAALFAGAGIEVGGVVHDSMGAYYVADVNQDGALLVPLVFGAARRAKGETKNLLPGAGKWADI